MNAKMPGSIYGVVTRYMIDAVWLTMKIKLAPSVCGTLEILNYWYLPVISL